MKHFLLVFLLAAIIASANDGQIHDAAITSVNKTYNVDPVFGIIGMELSAELVNFSPKDSLVNVEVHWTITSPDRFSDLESLQWNKMTKDYSQQPLDSYKKPLFINSDRDVFTIPIIPFGSNYDENTDNAMLIICTHKPNGEDDANPLNDTLRYLIEKPKGDMGIIEFTSPQNTVQANQPQGDSIRVIVSNNSHSFAGSFSVKFKVDNLSGGSSQDWKTVNFSYSGDDMLPPGSGGVVNLGTFNFDENDMYMITAVVDDDTYYDKNSNGYFQTISNSNDGNAKNDTAFQFLRKPDPSVRDFSAAGVYTINSPKPGDYKGTREIYASIKNNGSQPLHAVQVRWVLNNAMQKDLVPQYDTDKSAFYMPQQLVWRIKNWTTTNFYFETPLDSGEIRQVLLGADNFGDENVLIASSLKPNGVDFRTALDTARLFVGDYLLGNYVIGDPKQGIAQFKDLQEADKVLNDIKLPAYPNTTYPSDVDPAKVRRAPYGVGPGVKFYLRAGEYDGLKFSGLYDNQSQNNPITFQGFYDDSTAAVIKAPSGEKAPFTFDNAQYFVISHLQLQSPSTGHSLLFENGSKNNQVKASYLQGASTTSSSPDYAVIMGKNETDSTQISFSTFNGGSYGAYFEADDSDEMIVISDCNFVNQANTAITLKNHHYATVIRNDIYNNRVEFINCEKPYAGGNRIQINDDSKIGNGLGYSGKPYSALAFLSCSDTVSTNANNICVTVRDFNGVHIKDNDNQGDDYSILVNSSIQTRKYGVLLENTSKFEIANTSLDNLSGQSEDDAALYVKSDCKNIKLNTSAFNSSAGGYAIIFEDKSSLEVSNKNNFHTTIGSFARIDNPQKDISTIKEWQDEFKFDGDAVSTNLNPEFYSACDLIVCNNQIFGLGYQQCARGPVPPIVRPDNNLQGHTNSSMLFEWAFSPQVIGYWMQVSTDAQFTEIYQEEGKYSEDIPLSGSESMIFDEQFIVNSFATVNNLQPNTDYFWRVRVYSVSGQRSDWSETRKFTTGDVVPVSVEEMPKPESNELVIVPNPTFENVKFVFNSNQSQNYTITIYDNVGRIVYKDEIGSFNSGINQYQINNLSSFLETGFYFVAISSGMENFFGKLIKQ